MQSVSLGRRIGALFVDWIVASLSAAAFTGMSLPPQGPRNGAIVQAIFCVEVALLVGLLGFSIGKRVFGLRVEGPDGGSIGLPRALLRTVLMSFVIPALIMNEDRRGLHDLAAGSRVVRAGPVAS